MAEILTKIYAPDLGENYGANIKTTFDNINKNFGVIGSKGFSEGPAGDGWKFDSIALSSLLEGDDKYVDGIRTAIGDTGRDADVEALINQLKGSSMPITVGRVNSDLPDVDEPWKNSYPIVFIDERFADLDTVDHGAIDLSGMLVLTGVENSGSVITSTTWSYSQPFPTLYYKTVEGVGGFYWKINGNKTDIPAQGPTGPSGKDGRFWLVRVAIGTTIPAGGANIRLVQYMKADSQDGGWSYMTDFEGKNGDSCIVMQEDDINEYWISNIYKDGDDFYAWVGDANKVNVTQNFTEQKFFNLMMNITPSSTHTKSLFVKADNDDNTYAFGSDGDGVMKIGMAGEDGALRKEGDAYSEDLDNPLIVIGGRVATQYVSVGGISYNKATGRGSHAEGNNTRASDDCSHAEGYGTTAASPCSHAEGKGTEANGNYSHAEGEGTISVGIGSHAEGQNTTANGNYSHAEGKGTEANGNYSHAEGDTSRFFPFYEYNLKYVPEEYQNFDIFGSATFSIVDVILYPYVYTTATGYAAVYSIKVDGGWNPACVEGLRHAVWTADDQQNGLPFVITRIFNVENDQFDIQVMCLDSDGNIQTYGVLDDEKSETISPVTIVPHKPGAYGFGSHVEGYSNMAYGYWSHAEGGCNIAFNEGSHVEGLCNVAIQKYSKVSGIKNDFGFVRNCKNDQDHFEIDFGLYGSDSKYYYISGYPSGKMDNTLWVVEDCHGMGDENMFNATGKPKNSYFTDKIYTYKYAATLQFTYTFNRAHTEAALCLGVPPVAGSYNIQVCIYERI